MTVPTRSPRRHLLRVLLATFTGRRATLGTRASTEAVDPASAADPATQGEHDAPTRRWWRRLGLGQRDLAIVMLLVLALGTALIGLASGRQPAPASTQASVAQTSTDLTTAVAAATGPDAVKVLLAGTDPQTMQVLLRSSNGPHVLAAAVPDTYTPALLDRLLAAHTPVFTDPADADFPPVTTTDQAGAQSSPSGTTSTEAPAGARARASTAAQGASNDSASNDSASNDSTGNASQGLWLTLAVVSFGAAALMLITRRRYTYPPVTAPAAAAGDRPARPAGRGETGQGDQARFPVERPTTRFTDVAGADEAVADLRELVEFLIDPTRFTRTGAKAPKGALLVGPPGTGKTLLARAVAGEAGVPFFVISGAEMVERYVGVGPERMRALFAAAGKHEKAIIFIDEIDAFGRKRSETDSAGAQEHENTLIQLMTLLDGFEASSVVVLAATNRADLLDPALTRPGRLDRRVEVPLPDRRGRERILRVHLDGKPVADGVDLVALARRTPGFSGAQLEQVVNEGCMEAVRRDLDVVDEDCLAQAVATVAMGRARTSALVTEHDRVVTAWHEAGHTVSALLHPDADDPVQVSIVPRGPAGGVTWMSGSDEQFLTRRKAHAQLVVALSGRAAEELCLDGEYTQGASGDLQSATELAVRMAAAYGMTRLGLTARPLGGPGLPADVAEVVEELLADALARARALLGQHRDLVAAVAAALLEHEDLSLADLLVLTEDVLPTGGPARLVRAGVPAQGGAGAALRDVAAPPASSRALARAQQHVHDKVGAPPVPQLAAAISATTSSPSTIQPAGVHDAAGAGTGRVAAAAGAPSRAPRAGRQRLRGWWGRRGSKPAAPGEVPASV